MFTTYDVGVVRHVVQRILVPCVFVIGLIGNSVSIYVLTRKRMRCTTNIYLTALAITDLMYLTMALLLSLEHYPSIHRCCKFYWLSIGVVLWLCDACAYISIYIAVCFTVERFIAIRYPLKRQTFCTETLAKNVIAGLTIFCLVSTICTAFEHDFITTFRLVNSSGEACNQSVVHFEFSRNTPPPFQHHSIASDYENVKENEVVDDGSGGNGLVANPLLTDTRDNEGKYLQRLLILTDNNRQQQQQQQQKQENQNINVTSTFLSSANIPKLHSAADELSNISLLMDAEYLNSRDSNDDGAAAVAKTLLSSGNMHKPANSADVRITSLNAKIYDADVEENEGQNGTSGGSIKTNLTRLTNSNITVPYNCLNITYYEHTASALGNNELYIKIWYFFTLFVFVLIPLCMLVTFNSFLILLVRKSKTVRGEMTNAHSIRRTKHKANTSMSVSQENRVTVTLIAVVLLFIVCQLPWAIYLIVSEQMYIDGNTRKIIGNIFNFLAALNAAGNFFLYCVLSDKYRRTVRELITGYRYRHQRYTLNSARASLYVNGSRRSHRPSTTSIVIK